MADFVDSTVKDIDNRLRELKDEVSRLEAARAALAGGRRAPSRPARAASSGAASSATASTTRRRTRRGPGRPRGRHGGNTRANQTLELVRARPGITIPEIAAQMKIEPNYLYRVTDKLVKEGQIRREGQGWHPKSS